MSSEIEETLRRIQSHKGVKGVMVVSANGTPIPPFEKTTSTGSNLEGEQTTTYAALLSQLAMKASSVVRTLDETDELTFFRIRSLKHEIMIAPDKEHGRPASFFDSAPSYFLIVIQRPAES